MRGSSRWRRQASGNATWSRRSTTLAAVRGCHGAGGDYPAIVPMLPSGIGRGGAASDLGRPADAGGRGNVLRDRRLSTSAITARCRAPSFWRAAAEISQCRAGGARRHGGRARRGAARQPRRGYRQGAFIDGARRASASEGKPHRLFDRPLLSARLGRADMSLRPGEKTVLEPNMTFHFMPASGSPTGARDLRDHPDRRTGSGMPRLGAAQALRQGLTGGQSVHGHGGVRRGRQARRLSPPALEPRRPRMGRRSLQSPSATDLSNDRPPAE